MNDLLVAMDNKECNFLVLLDQSAAFDTVNQVLMISSLQSSFDIGNGAL